MIQASFRKRLCWNPLYGLDGVPRHPYRISFEDLRREDPKSPLWEFPAAVARVGGFDLPVSGGFYLRTLPAPVFRVGFETDERGRGHFMFIFTPGSVTKRTPRIPLPFLARKATYYGMTEDPFQSWRGC